MRLPSSYRRAVVLAVAALALAHGAAVAQPPPLFAATGRTTTPAMSAPTPVSRARLVTVRRDLLAAAFVSTSAPDAPFALNLFDDVTLLLHRVHVDFTTTHRTWVGADSTDEALAALTVGPSGLSGSVLAHGRAYALEPTGAGEVVVRELAPGAPPAELPARQLADRTAMLWPGGLAAGGPTIIDVLVLYTPAARLRAGGATAIQASLANAVAVTNAALQRSGVAATIAAVGIEELPYAESAGGLGGDLFDIGSGGAMHGAVSSRRAAVGADLVALVTGRTTPSGGCGVAYLGPSPAAIFSVTEEACLFAGQWSFSHEVGHNLGADHAPDDPVVSPVPYARGYRDPSVRTLMAYPVPGTPPRSLNYSSSIVREPAGTGAATGNSLQDNARRLNETAAIVAGYAVSTAPAPDTPFGLAASVIGATVTITWTPAATGGPVAFYALEAGPAPGVVAYGPFTATTPSLVFPDVDAGRYFVRLRSRGPGGQSAPSGDLQVDVPGHCAVPGPASLSAGVDSRLVTLVWSAPPGDGPSTYEVGLGSATGAFDLGIFAVGPLTGATLPAPPGRYFVRARAVNRCGPGGASPEIAVVVP